MNEEEILQKQLELVEGMDERHAKRLRSFQKKFFDVLVALMAEKLNRDADGNLSSSARNFAISNIVETAWTEVNDDYRDTVARLMNEMLKGSNLTNAYMRFQTDSNTRLKKAKERADQLLFRSLGLKPTTKRGQLDLVRGGFFDTILEDSSIRTELKRVLINSVSAKQDYKQTTDQIRRLLRGTRERQGRFERYYQVNVYDTLNQADRLHNQAYAEQLDLKAFVYSGTVIGNTRGFCKARAGKVFLTSEAEEWRRERWNGKTDNYSPLRDLGGYNCRHRVSYISNAKAVRRRRDLYIDEQGNLNKRDG